MPVLRTSLRHTTRRSALLVGFAVLTTLFPAGMAAAEPPTTKAADEVLVRYRADTSRPERGRVAREHGLTPVRTSRDGRTQVVVGEGRSRATVRRELKDDPRVLAVADNHRRELTDDFTDEPYFRELWGLHNSGQTLDGIKPQTGISDIDIDGLEALRITRGDDDVVVAVVDDGIDFSHPDLASRAWTNPGEAGAKATNGVDDDGNGFIDDVHGWDFCNNDNSVSDPDEDFHGTHVAGTIAASLNGTGVVGVAPGIKVMAVKFIDDSGTCGADDMAIAAIDYAASFDVPIINASWGGPDPSSVLDAAIAESGALLVAAAGNGNRSTGLGIDLDKPGGPRFYPANSTLPNVVTVAAIDQRGQLAAFSNYGKVSVDLSAPGTNVLSSIPSEPDCDPCWAWIAGTSMSAPHVSGVAALVLSVLSGTPTPAALRARLLSTGQPLASTVGKTATGRLVNALRAIDRVGPVALPINRHGINVGTIVGSTVSTTMTWPAATDALSGVKSYAIKRSLNGAAWTTLIASTTTRSYKRAMSFGTPTRFQLYARDGAGNLGGGAIGPTVTATLRQDVATSALTYTGRWANVTLSSASGGRLHRATRSGSTVTFTTTARAIAVVGRRGPLNGKAKVYVDGVYKSTIDTYRSSYQSRVVVFNISWNTAATHSVKVVNLATSRRPRLDIDALAFLR
jgi:subtilisin family serine protease